MKLKLNAIVIALNFGLIKSLHDLCTIHEMKNRIYVEKYFIKTKLKRIQVQQKTNA